MDPKMKVIVLVIVIVLAVGAIGYMVFAKPDLAEDASDQDPSPGEGGPQASGAIESAPGKADGG